MLKGVVLQQAQILHEISHFKPFSVRLLSYFRNSSHCYRPMRMTCQKSYGNKHFCRGRATQQRSKGIFSNFQDKL